MLLIIRYLLTKDILYNCANFAYICNKVAQKSHKTFKMRPFLCTFVERLKYIIPWLR